MRCKICGYELVKSYSGVFLCGSDNEGKDHDYGIETSTTLNMEEFSVADKNGNEHYTAYIRHDENRTNIYVSIGQAIHTTTELHIALKIDRTTPEEFVDRIKKLLILA